MQGFIVVRSKLLDSPPSFQTHMPVFSRKVEGFNGYCNLIYDSQTLLSDQTDARKRAEYFVTKNTCQTLTAIVSAKLTKQKLVNLSLVNS